MKTIILALLGALVLPTAQAQSLQPYPNKTIRLVIPLAAGSAVDNAARIVTSKMSQSLGQSIVIENLPGAAGLTGADKVAKAAPDGYTLGGFNDSVMTMVPHLHKSVPWDIMKDFEPISLVATVEWGLIASPQSAFKNAGDLIQSARAMPGKIDYASGGNGSPQHVAMALFAAQAGVSLTHVPYKGATQAATDVAANQVPVAFQGLATVASLVRGGKLRLIGVSTKTRHPQFPDVPTVSESGLTGFEFNSWFAMLAPAGTPKEIVAKLNVEIVKALGDPEVKEKLNQLGLSARGTSASDLGALTKAQFAKYAQLMQQAGIKAE